jgi:hypothetical protein
VSAEDIHPKAVPDGPECAELLEVIGRSFLRLAGLIRGGRRRGRPPRKDVDAAMRMQAGGATRTEVYRQLGKSTPSEQRALREAIRQRRRRARLRAETPQQTE